ncbi:MAG: yqfF [Parachlamydiales bacterium]|nr:yqfF [Parachlamydiales bacterium]
MRLMKDQPSAPNVGLMHWLSVNDRGWRLFICFVCTFCLALFLHFREVRLEVLELNTAANRYIVAQTDFEFPDYESTIILKQQAMQDVGLLFQLDSRQIREESHELENTLIHTKDWHSAAPASTFEEMYKAIDEMESLLLEARFTDARTLQVIKELSLPDASYYEFIPEGPGLAHILPDEFWSIAALRIDQSDAFHPETIAYVVKMFQIQSWDLMQDTAQERFIRGAVSKTVPEKFTRVQAGTRLIEPGERIVSRHLTMMQAMKQAISDSRKVWELLPIVSSLLLALIFVAISGLYFHLSRQTFTRSLQQLSMVVCIVLLTLFFAKMTEYALIKSASPFFENVRYPIIAPFAASLICILLSPNIALFAATFISIILSVSLAVDHSRFLLLNLITSILVILFARHLRKRKEVFAIYFKAWLGSIPILFTFTLSEGHLGSLLFINDVAASFFFLMASSVLVVGLLPVLETIFHVLTDMTLMEYMDPCSPLLQKMAMEAPGTYQHCLVLANLAESCAVSIGANGLLCRVATLYHDIGKIPNPQFYSENQQSSVNIHQLLTPYESAQVIISHVSDGEELASQYHLPQSFIDVIRQHHGTTLVYYFYCKQLELKGNRKDDVDQSQFRYPGPKPRSKEAAIIMICDAVEAASRSWEDVSESTLLKMVDRLVSEKAEDGQFDECNITFEELSRVKAKLVKSLLLTHHIRVKYPQKV